MSALVDRLDDAINPIVVRELRQAVQSRLVTYGLMLFLLLQLVVLGFYVMWGDARQNLGIDFTAGRQAFGIIQALLAGSCLLFIPIYAGVRLALERNDANVDLLFISALKPRSIIAGKFVAAGVLTLLVFSACAPFMAFSYLLRGLDIPSILLVLVIDLIAVLLATQFTLLVAVLPFHWVLKGLIGLWAFGVLWMLVAMTVGLTSRLLLSGVGVQPDSWEFWGGLASGVGVSLLLMGLMFVCAVALVSPATSNRALPVRLYLLAAVTLSGALAVGWAWAVTDDGPLYAWLFLAGAALCGYLVVAINERDRWGPRVARTIPRRAILRASAFLLYSGSAGGVLYTVLLTALLLGAFLLFATIVPGISRDAKQIDAAARTMLAAALYTYNYGLAAALAQAWLFDRWIRPLHTWVLALVFLGLGSALPAVFAYVVMRERMYSGPSWWWLTNPLASLPEFTSTDNTIAMSYAQGCLLFLGIWAALTTLVGLPWFWAQLRRFQPSVKG